MGSAPCLAPGPGGGGAVRARASAGGAGGATRLSRHSRRPRLHHAYGVRLQQRQARRGNPLARKTPITVMLDNDVIEAFRARAEAQGTGYQTAINEALRAALDSDDAPLTARRLRQVLREELRAKGAGEVRSRLCGG
ncbi:MAG TPA: BrnA antitoxin family protein [Gammaproteobacteria bacterium]|nr:BrnA antitoxin family protein [Gammaproteobacteria bacterium]